MEGHDHPSYPHLFEPLDLGFTTLKIEFSWPRCTSDLELLETELNEQLSFMPRGRGGTALIVTGGYGPNPQGVIEAGADYLNSMTRSRKKAKFLRPFTRQAEKSHYRFPMQAGAKVDDPVGASIFFAYQPRKVRALTTDEVENDRDYVNCAALLNKLAMTASR